jgi:hypothetical protein
VGDGVDPALPQLLAQLRVPVVLHVVVRPPRQLVRDQRPPAKCMEFVAQISAPSTTCETSIYDAYNAWLDRTTISIAG